MYVPGNRLGWRCIFDCPAFAQYLFGALAPVLPKIYQNEDIADINERCRYLFYEPGQAFAEHYDGCYQRDPGHSTEKEGRRCRSRITLQLYLNDVPAKDGGATTFIADSRGARGANDIPCNPKAGSILIFSQNLLHEGSTLESGCKYTMRSEVMYCPRPLQ